MPKIKDSSVFNDFKENSKTLEDELKSIESDSTGWFTEDFIKSSSFDDFCINCYKFSISDLNINKMVNQNLVRLAKEGELPITDNIGKIKSDIDTMSNLINEFKSNADLVPNDVLAYLESRLFYRKLELISFRNRN